MLDIGSFNSSVHGVPAWHARGYVDFPDWQRTLHAEPSSERAQRVREWLEVVNTSPLGYKSAEAAALARAEHQRMGLTCCA